MKEGARGRPTDRSKTNLELRSLGGDSPRTRSASDGVDTRSSTPWNPGASMSFPPRIQGSGSSNRSSDRYDADSTEAHPSPSSVESEGFAAGSSACEQARKFNEGRLARRQ